MLNSLRSESEQVAAYELVGRTGQLNCSLRQSPVAQRVRPGHHATGKQWVFATILAQYAALPVKRGWRAASGDCHFHTGARVQSGTQKEPQRTLN